MHRQRRETSAIIVLSSEFVSSSLRSERTTSLRSDECFPLARGGIPLFLFLFLFLIPSHSLPTFLHDTLRYVSHLALQTRV